MMERFDISAQDLKSFGFTTLFCIVIALATMSIWGGLFGEHLAISFSYGYSAFFSAQWIARRWPELSKRLVNILSLSCAVVLGTSSAYLCCAITRALMSFLLISHYFSWVYFFRGLFFVFLFSRTKNPSSRRIGSGSPPPVGARKSAVIESTQAATKSDGASFSIQYFGQY